jgi:hypothetical protein
MILRAGMFNECSDLENKGIQTDSGYPSHDQFFKSRANFKDMATPWRSATVNFEKDSVRVFEYVGNNGDLMALFLDLIASSINELLYVEIYSL